MGYYLYALEEFKWTPKRWIELKPREKALVIACIDLVIEKEQESQREN